MCNRLNPYFISFILKIKLNICLSISFLLKFNSQNVAGSLSVWQTYPLKAKPINKKKIL